MRRTITSLKRAFTILEVLVSCAILILLMAILFEVFRSGAGAFAKIDAHSDLVQSFGAVGARLVGEVNQTCLVSLSTSPTNDTAAFARPVSSTDAAYTLGTDGGLTWKSYRVYYFDSAGKHLMLRDLDMPTASESVLPLERSDIGMGVQPLSYYDNSGRAVLQNVVGCQFQMQGGALLLKLVGNVVRYGSASPEQFQLQFQTTPRN